MYLRPREQQMIDTIRELSKSGLPPTSVELRNAMGIRSQRMTCELIEALRSKGLLLRFPGRRQRAIVLAPEALKAAAEIFSAAPIVSPRVQKREKATAKRDALRDIRRAEIQEKAAHAA